MEFRVGLGQDCHRLVTGRPLILGGVRIEHETGLYGHSDADVLLHAITDAVLGAAGLGDIGEMFPDTSPKHAGADSAVLLQEALERVWREGWRVINLDCTVAAEQPKLSPFKSAIRRRVAELLHIPESATNVKAKTGEKVGPVGRREAMTAEAVVLLAREAQL